MDPVTVDELTLDLDQWARLFEERRPGMIAYRAARRAQLGDLMHLDFEDRTTVAWQVNRMIGVENITDPEKVGHELATYNVLVPGHQELCATLLIGVGDMDELRRWKPLLAGINDKVFLSVDGDRAKLIPDDEGTRDHEPPMVQYLRWVLTDEQVTGIRGAAEVRVGVDHPNYQFDAPVPAPLRRALPGLVG